MATNYKELIAWQKAMALAKAVYRTTAKFPESERFGLVSQLRRAAVSVPSNIAEGQGRLTDGEFRQFLGNARGSLYEVETQLILADSMGFVSAAECAELNESANEVGRLLNGLLRSLGSPRQAGASKTR